MDLSDFKTTFDGILQTHIEEFIAQSKNLLGDNKLNAMVEYIQTFLFSGGKRIRPYCLRAVYMGLGGELENEIMHVGIILELFHSMALIHDDIIDQADKRHNAASFHSYITSLLGDKDNAKHMGESQAILIGDIILARVYRLLNELKGFDPKHIEEAKKNIYAMIEECIIGQMIDVNMMTSGPASKELIDKKNMYKTASYTFVRPMLTGAILAGATPQQQGVISELGLHLGLAFQVRDDLMDLTGGDKTKSLFTDIQEGQQTLFTYYIMSQGTDEQKALLTSCLGKKLDEKKIDELKEMFQSSGAIDRGKQQIKEHLDQARAIFESINLPNEKVKESFSRMMKKMEK